jgi:hypothetical protein
MEEEKKGSSPTDNVYEKSKQAAIPSSKNLKEAEKAKLNLKSGYRLGSPEHLKVKRVIEFEVEELGNTQIIEEAAKSLGCSKDLASVFKAIEERWGEDAEAVWLWNKKRDAEDSNGHPGQLEKSGKAKPDEVCLITLPDNAEVIIDLKGEGKLFVYNKEIKPHKF